VDNDQRLKNLIRYARERFEKGAALRLLEGETYVRASASGFRVVSVSSDAPLCDAGARPVKDIQVAKRLAKNSQSADRPRLVSSTAKAKRERCLQAYLLREALKEGRGGDLSPVLGGCLPFERLIFALDEVPLHDGSAKNGLIRCDLLAVAQKDSRLEPVVIELKWGRTLARLEAQLNGYSGLLARYGTEFSELLGAATGLQGTIWTDRVHHVIVWPGPKTRDARGTPRVAESTADALRRAHISAIQFDDAGGKYEFVAEAISAEPAWPRNTPTMHRHARDTFSRLRER
jgi:hypothetical protein